MPLCRESRSPHSRRPRPHARARFSWELGEEDHGDFGGPSILVTPVNTGQGSTRVGVRRVTKRVLHRTRFSPSQALLQFLSKVCSTRPEALCGQSRSLLSLQGPVQGQARDWHSTTCAETPG